MDLTVTLNTESSKTALAMNDNKLSIFGATFEPLSEKEKARFRLTYGFKITRIEQGKFSEAGIRTGFILVNVDRQPVTSTSGLKEALTGKDGGVLLDGLYPNGMRAYYGLGL